MITRVIPEAWSQSSLCLRTTMECCGLERRGNSSVTIGPFTSAGTFKLYCTVHVGMSLTVIVQEGMKDVVAFA